jgi:hypothetical protein
LSSWTEFDLRTPSRLTAADIDNLLKNCPMAGLGLAFVKAGAKHNVNARYLCAHAIHESGWGRSAIAQTKNNLFGFQAYDESPMASAKVFKSLEECVDYCAGYISTFYLTPGGRYYNGPTLKGMNVKYATDQKWADKIAQIMQQMPAEPPEPEKKVVSDGTLQGVPKDHWAREPYERMFGQGLVVGNPLGVMHPGDHITEARMVAFLDRLVSYLDMEEQIETLIRVYRSGTVKVNVTYRYPSGEVKKGGGSGSFFADDGYILTNKHVTDNGVEFAVETVFGKFPGRLICDSGDMIVGGSSVDLAVIKVDLPAGVRPAVIPWSWEQPKAGKFVLLFGNPMLQEAVSWGAITDMVPDEWLQTQAPINPGNSGGVAVLIREGRACGVPTWKYGGAAIDNLGFMTPGDVVKKFLDTKFRR